MKIGIIGSGEVGQALGAGFRKKGHEVLLGTRDPGKMAAWAKTTGAAVGSFTEAATFGELIVLCVKGDAAESALALAGAAHLAGKVIMDTTNPISPAPPKNGVLAFFTDLNDSLMERLQRAYPKARFVKGFSSVGSAKMVDPGYPGGPPTMFICGNDAAAKQVVAKVCTDFGWEPLDCGAVEGARAIEPLAMLWCIPGFLQNEWTHAFKVVHA